MKKRPSPMAATRRLVVGFDSAWTIGKSGALAAVCIENRIVRSLGPPQLADFSVAYQQIRDWQQDGHIADTLIFIDQPTIVPNLHGQRPVEHIVCSAISRRKGGVQPANRSRVEMFGDPAPIWPFLSKLGGASPIEALAGRSGTFETYPALILAALGIESVASGAEARRRLPKYNPQNRTQFRLDDWRLVCERIAHELAQLGAGTTADWVASATRHARPMKPMQDQLDAAICLLAALRHALQLPSLRVGDASGFIVVPHSSALEQELADRCIATGRQPAAWIEVVE
jgi:predicted RNase H-like nuclease